VFAYETAGTARASLGLVIGTDVQAFGAVLDDLNTLGPNAADSEFLVGTAAGALAWESGATVRASLGLVIGTDVADLSEHADAVWEAGTNTTPKVVAPDAIAAAIAALATGGWTLIDTQTVSGTPASLDLTHANIGNYRNIKLVGFGFSNTTSSSLQMRVSTDGGSSFIATGYGSRAFDFGAGASSSTAILMLEAATTNDMWFVAEFHEFNQASACYVQGTVSTSGGTGVGGIYKGIEGGTTARDAIQLRYSTGNLDAGTVLIFGMD
jgi:hypothetical protein